MILHLVLIASALAAPSEPPHLGVREALAQGRAAFIGRVVRVEELELRRKDTEAVLEVEAVRCLYGTGCMPGRRLRFDYLAQTLDEGVWAVEFSVAEEDLFVLEANPDPDAIYRFDSEPKNGFDIAFRGAKVPKRKLDIDAASYVSVYGGAPETVRATELEAWAKARSKDLRPGEPAAAAASAGSPDLGAEPPAEAEAVDLVPQLIQRVEPKFPGEAKGQHLEGAVVVVEVVIDTAGRVAKAEFLKGNPIFEAAARAAVLQWRYSPGRRDGREVAVRMPVTVTFKSGR